MNYHASMVQDALIDFDRFKQLGVLDEQATRELVANPQSEADLAAIIAIFQDAADRAKA
jgi:aminoglycoside phosphotransferase family enzyme